MALYVSAGRRRRRLLLAAGGALVLGLLVGALLGRTTAPSPADDAAEAKRAAAQASGLLQAVPDHYEQMVTGDLDPTTFQASLDDGLTRAAAQLDVALAKAAWVDPPAADALRAEVAKVRADAQRGAPPAELRNDVQVVVVDLGQRFGTAR